MTSINSIQSNGIRPFTFSDEKTLPAASEPAPVVMRKLEDYLPPDFTIPEIQLIFDLDLNKTIVYSLMTIEPQNENAQLVLDGNDQTIHAIRLNNKDLIRNWDFTLTADQLRIHNPPKEKFTLELKIEIDPSNNKDCTGLYLSNGRYCTKCESEYFRKITYFLDRPDVLSRFTVTIIGNSDSHPFLLSNGNKIKSLQLPENRHTVTYEDPIPKPCYLFALIAGDFTVVRDSFQTMSKKNVDIEFYVEKGKDHLIKFAMDALKRAMKWDEHMFGREYDLDTLRVVSVANFNSMACENKGLLVFNEIALIGDAATSTDNGLMLIEEVISHEYFHNWTGNRVTIRDWFHVALKEGVTSFRHRWFSEISNNPETVRLKFIKALLQQQYPEDDGPQSHSVLPQSCANARQNYTHTTYKKGAELMRMLHIIMGREAFLDAFNDYFEEYDGKASTFNELLFCMQSKTEISLKRFFNWFHQSGVPIVTASYSFDAANNKLSLTLSQSNGTREPLLIPVKMSLISKTRNCLVPIEGDDDHCVILLDEAEKKFEFSVDESVTPSLFEELSAPVRFTGIDSTEDLLHLAKYSHDLYVRYDALQKLQNSSSVIEAYKSIWKNLDVDMQELAALLEIPHLDDCWQQIAQAVEQDVLNVNTIAESRLSSEKPGAEKGARALKNVCLTYLFVCDRNKYAPLIMDWYLKAREMNNMTLELHPLELLASTTFREEAIQLFNEKWKDVSTVIIHKFRILASSDHSKLFETIRHCAASPEFDKKNTNHLRSLYETFAHKNPNFHECNGKGYALITSVILDEEINESVKVDLLKAFDTYPVMDPARQSLMKCCLKTIYRQEILSNQLRGAAKKILDSV